MTRGFFRIEYFNRTNKCPYTPELDHLILSQFFCPTTDEIAFITVFMDICATASFRGFLRSRSDSIQPKTSIFRAIV
jgi:hypothetical protein